MLKRFTPILALTALCWVVFAVNLVMRGSLLGYGIVPRQFSGLWGVLWAPFLHGSYAHLMANSVPLLILGGVLCARSPSEFLRVTILGILLGGGLTWVWARDACHVGASGLIFCYFGYLASLAWFRHTFGTLALSLVCVVLYGGMLRGIVPTAGPISWEAHASGFGAGIVIAWLTAGRKRGTPPRERQK